MAIEKLLGSGSDKTFVDVKRATILATGTSATLVATVTGRKIRILSAVMGGSATTTISFRTGTTVLIQPVNLTAGNVAVLTYNPLGWCEGDVGADINLVIGTAGNLGVTVQYLEVL